MRTLDIIKEELIKKSFNSNYRLEKSKLKAEFYTMCNTLLSSPEESLVFSLLSTRSLSTFLDIVDDEDIRSFCTVNQEENDIFRVELKGISFS